MRGEAKHKYIGTQFITDLNAVMNKEADREQRERVGALITSEVTIFVRRLTGVTANA